MKKFQTYFYILSIFLLTSLQGEESMATAVTSQINLYDLTQVYQGSDGFNYSVPQETLQSWCDGVGFGREVRYTKDEYTQLQQDANEIFANQSSQGLSVGREVIITAGAPGAGKTTLLEQIQEGQVEIFGYSDPDAVSLKKMTRTYQTQIKKTDGETLEGQQAARKTAYADWRPASNAILMNARFMQEGISFCYGTTATGDKTHYGFKALKDQGYKITLIHLTAPDAVRVASIKERDKEFIQTTDEDIIEKAALLPQRIADTYVKYADTIKFYHRDAADKDAILSAVWIRGEGAAAPSLEIKDETAYNALKTWHNSNLNEADDLKWEKTVEAHLK